MGLYAIVNAANTVENIVVWDGESEWAPDSAFALVACEGFDVGIGHLYDPAAGSFTAPIPVAPGVMPMTSITPLKFIERFTDDEQLAIVTATMTDPAVKLWYDKLLAAQDVVFADPRLSAGLDNLVTAGLITAERKAEILPQATEGVTVL